MNITEMCEKAHKTAKEHGFWDGEMTWKDETMNPPNEHITIVKRTTTLNSLFAKLALIHSEVSEAVEVLRTPNSLKWPPALREELADILIRTADFAAALGLDLEKAVQDKMTKNEGRPWKHGRLA